MRKTLNLSALLLLLSLAISCSSVAPNDTGAIENQKIVQEPHYMAEATEEAAIEEDFEAVEGELADEDIDAVVDPDHHTEEYDKIHENTFKDATQTPVSTFSIDVDNASYSNVRRFLNANSLPPAGSVRIEEMINYFTYDYPQPQGKHPFSINTEIAPSPWNKDHHLIHIGLQGKSLNYDELKPSNLVFLIDASGSMSNDNKLPLLKKSLKLLLKELGDQDRIAIVAYAGAAGLVLPSTPATQTNTIINALDKLSAGG